MIRMFRRFLIARAIRRVIGPYRMGKAQQAHDDAVGRVVEVAGDHHYGWKELGASFFADPPAAPPKPKREPGRQPIRMATGDGSMFGFLSGGSAFQPLPKTAKAIRWEDCHDFGPYAARPVRDPIYGLRSPEPAMALVCIDCEVQQPPLTSGSRDCPYCGLRMKLHGSLVYYWRDEVKPALEWKP